MSGADLLEDGFPHSTPQGYRGGCQGHGCPGVVDNGISCADSFARYQGDYGFRKKVDAGMSPKDIVAAERAATTIGAPKPRPLQKPKAEPLPEELLAEEEAAWVADHPDGKISAEEQESIAAYVDESRDERLAAEGEIEPKLIAADVTPTPVGEKEIPLEEHGTTTGYNHGCRLKDACPGIARVGQSCTQAINAYQRDLKRARKKRVEAEIQAMPISEPERGPEAAEAPSDVIPDEALDTVAEHELAGKDSEGELCSCGHHGASLPEHLSEIILGWRNEATTLREKVAALQKRIDDGPEQQQAAPALATLPDGTRVSVTVTIERAA